MPYASVSSSRHSQKRWIEHMKLNYLHLHNHDISPRVLQVPESLRNTKPEAYAPQIVGLGPYHHFRPEVQQMERKKSAAVISYLKGKNIGSDLVGQICKETSQPTFHSRYDAYLDLDDETLAWVVIVDSLFLLHFMSTYLGESEEEKRNIYSNIEALVRDIIMLENQIPITLMEKVRFFLDLSCGVEESVMKENIHKMRENIHQFCVRQSPLQFTTDEKIKEGAFNQNNHILHYMYELIVKNQSKTDGKDSQGRTDGGSSQGQMDSTSRTGELAKEIGVQAVGCSQGQTDSTSRVGELAEEIGVQAGGSSQGRTDSTSRVGDLAKEIGVQAVGCSQGQTDFASRVGKLAEEIGVQAGEIFELAIEEFNTLLANAKLAGLKVPGDVEKVLNILRILPQILHLDHMKGSLGDQIDIPSASRLKAILKLQFEKLPDNGGVGDIELKNNALRLPVITLNSNSEVILRNLIAYESTSKMPSTKLRDYMDLICGLIKSEKDAALLRENKIIIIKDQLPDAEIVRMFKGIKKSDEKSDENSNVHQTVTDVKKKFNDKGIVKACRWTTKCFAALVNSIKQLFPILVLVFLALQSFCDMYDCRVWRSSYGAAALRKSHLGELELDPKAKVMLPRKLYRY